MSEKCKVWRQATLLPADPTALGLADELSKLMLDGFQSWKKRTHDSLSQENCCVLTTGQRDENSC